MSPHSQLKLTDIALERVDRYRETTHKRFKLTPTVAKLALYGLIVFPGAVYGISHFLTAKYDWRGARRGKNMSE